MAVTAGPLLLCGRPLGASRPRRSSTGGRWRRQGGSHFPQHPEGRCQGSIGHCRAPVLGSAHPRTSAFCANAPAGGQSPRTSLSRPHGDRPGEERRAHTARLSPAPCSGRGSAAGALCVLRLLTGRAAPHGPRAAGVSPGCSAIAREREEPRLAARMSPSTQNFAWHLLGAL